VSRRQLEIGDASARRSESRNARSSSTTRILPGVTAA